MTEKIETRHWFNELLTQEEHQFAGGYSNWLNRNRHEAKSLLDKMKMPEQKDEHWRYSNIDRIFSQQFKVFDKDATAGQDVILDEHLLPGSDSYQLVVVNGCYRSDVTDINDLPDAVTISSVQDVLLAQDEEWTTRFEQTFAQASKHQQHVFAALNTALMKDGIVMHLPEGTRLDRPIEIIYINSANDNPFLVQPRNLILMDKDTSATLIERYVSAGQPVYFNNNVTEIILDDKALLKHYRIQDDSKYSCHMGSIFVAQMAQSSYSNTTVSVGGKWARTDVNVQLKGQDAICHLNGLYTVGEQQLNDFHTRVKHREKGCVSKENFKGIVYGKGRAVFDGHIIVDKEAQETDAHMANANLLLTRKAEVDSKPQLEIYADNVHCSHGTTVGQLEPEPIFYLRSRGIDESRAKQILCLGFAAEVIDTIGIETIANCVKEQIQKQIVAADDVD